jgi:putative transposase
MPRPARHALLAETPATIHFIWRCHNRDFLLDADDVKQFYLHLLAQHKKSHGVEIYGYAIMTNHFHAVLRIPARTSWQNFSREVNSKLAVRINRARQRHGQVIMDRPRTIVLERDEDVLAVLRYIDLNPVRAGLVRRARDYRWSSYGHHALGRADTVLDECSAIAALGENDRQRRAAYVALFGTVYSSLDLRRRPDLVDVLFVGSPAWQQARQLSLRVSVKVRGRPPS